AGAPFDDEPPPPQAAATTPAPRPARSPMACRRLRSSLLFGMCGFNAANLMAAWASPEAGPGVSGRGRAIVAEPAARGDTEGSRERGDERAHALVPDREGDRAHRPARPG